MMCAELPMPAVALSLHMQAAECCIFLGGLWACACVNTKAGRVLYRKDTHQVQALEKLPAARTYAHIHTHVATIMHTRPALR